jgi:hypothetical protein
LAGRQVLPATALLGHAPRLQRIHRVAQRRGAFGGRNASVVRASLWRAGIRYAGISLARYRRCRASWHA